MELNELSEPHFHNYKEHNTLFTLRILGSVTKISTAKPCIYRSCMKTFNHWRYSIFCFDKFYLHTATIGCLTTEWLLWLHTSWRDVHGDGGLLWLEDELHKTTQDEACSVHLTTTAVLSSLPSQGVVVLSVCVQGTMSEYYVQCTLDPYTLLIRLLHP